MAQAPLARLLSATLLPAALLVAGCAPPPDEAAPSAEAAPAPPATPSPSHGPADAEALRDVDGNSPMDVARLWAEAVKHDDWRQAEAYWRDNADRRTGSGYGLPGLRPGYVGITMVEFGPGMAEGAAGSLYYSMPVRLETLFRNGLVERYEGELILSRVNNVPGATDEQLRWRLFRLSLDPASF